MNKSPAWRSVLYAILIFAAGLFSGLVITPMLFRMVVGPPRPAEMSRHMLSRLQSKLDLTSEQVAQIKPLVEQASSDLETMRIGTAKQVFDRIAETNSRIAAFLTPEQIAKLEKMEAERRAHLSDKIPFLPPPPPH